MILTAEGSSDEAVITLEQKILRISKYTNIQPISTKDHMYLLYHFYNDIDVSDDFFASSSVFFNNMPPKFSDEYIQLSNEKKKVILFLRGLPYNADFRTINKVFNEKFRVESSIHIQRADKNEVVRFFDLQMERIKKNYDEGKPDLFGQGEIIEEYEKLKKEVNHKQFFYTSIYFSINSDDLENDLNSVFYTFKKKGFNFEIVTTQVNDGFKSVMPIGWDKLRLVKRLPLSYILDFLKN
jgi:hypothetical protein